MAGAPRKPERVVADISAAGGKAKAALGDLSNDAGAEQAASAALAACGAIDILVNNAAVFRTDDWNNLDAADWIDQYGRERGLDRSGREIHPAAHAGTAVGPK